MSADPPLVTRAFVLICLATLLFYLSFYLILPVMPLYVASLGGTPIQRGIICVAERHEKAKTITKFKINQKDCEEKYSSWSRSSTVRVSKTGDTGNG